MLKPNTIFILEKKKKLKSCEKLFYSSGPNGKENEFHLETKMQYVFFFGFQREKKYLF